MGDSAGGNLALGLARYLAELADRSGRKEIKEIGQVGGMILYSVSLRVLHICRILISVCCSHGAT